jgi:hypothetical protein
MLSTRQPKPLNKAIPVPKLFWKAVYDPRSQTGVVVVGMNKSYISDPQEDYLICDDVCSKMYWSRWNQKNITQGHLYCCDVNDFRTTVKISHSLQYAIC